MKDKIKTYLLSGLQANDIANILGCSPGYISQLLKDPAFVADIQEAKEKDPPKTDEILENKYDAAEHRIVSRITAEALNADIGELSRALDSITKARESKKKGTLPMLQGVQNANNVVQVFMPAHIMEPPKLILNEKAEVIEIDGRPMAPLSADGVRNLFTQLEEKRNDSDRLEITAKLAAEALPLAATGS